MDGFLPPQPGLQAAHDMQQQMIQGPRPRPRPSQPKERVPNGGKSRRYRKSRRSRKSRRYRKSRR